jgi:hypothetical protein
MAHETFIERKFSERSITIIEHANAIIEEYQAQGFALTLRQLYYQFVARGLIPNRQSEYKRLGSIINDARLAGFIDWSAIEDRTRNVRRVSTWDSPSQILQAAAESYREDLWAEQPTLPECWIEKDALVSVIERVCNRWRVPYFACRGYSSQSEQYAAGKRFEAATAAGKMPIILHLGDHDPSGIDMTRDNADRLSMFAWTTVEVRRLALNYNQVEEYRPPPNPTKETDSRSSGYRERFGESSWELDALEPAVIADLIEQEIQRLVDQEAWNQGLAKEAREKRRLAKAARTWRP